MIRSGLVNIRRGGGFEEGFPHQRAPRNKPEYINPYVVRDGPYPPRSDITQIVPQPVQYRDLSARNLTPDEKLYLFQRVQKAGKIVRQKKKFSGLPDELLLGLPDPLNREQRKRLFEFFQEAKKFEEADQKQYAEETDMKGVTQEEPTNVDMDVDETNFGLGERAFGQPMDEYVQEIVANPYETSHQNTYAEEAAAQRKWANEYYDSSSSIGKADSEGSDNDPAHNRDDVYVPENVVAGKNSLMSQIGYKNTANGFSKEAVVADTGVSEQASKWEAENGSGPRKRSIDKRNTTKGFGLKKNKSTGDKKSTSSDGSNMSVTSYKSAKSNQSSKSKSSNTVRGKASKEETDAIVEQFMKDSNK